VDSLTQSHSRIDARWIEGNVVRREFVIARRDPPTLFDPIEEPFDQVARTMEIRAEAIRRSFTRGTPRGLFGNIWPDAHSRSVSS
jgi:hypothetical protein